MLIFKILANIWAYAAISTSTLLIFFINFIKNIKEVPVDIFDLYIIIFKEMFKISEKCFY